MAAKKKKLATNNDALSPSQPVALSATTVVLPFGGDQLPGGSQLHVDVHICLLDAMTDNFPIKRSDINAKTVPSKKPIGADLQGWGICLAGFAEYLHQLRPIYGFYVHKPVYTADTIAKAFPDIVLYLAQKIVAQLKGTD